MTTMATPHWHAVRRFADLAAWLGKKAQKQVAGNLDSPRVFPIGFPV